MVVLLKLTVASLLVFGGAIIPPCRAQRVIAQALYLGTPEAFNTSREDCVWKHNNERDICPDARISVILYTTDGVERHKNVFDIQQSDWLRNSAWNRSKESIILIHGYAGGDDTLPIMVLRDAYLRQGDYNVFMVDWGAFAQPPCYIAAVYNLKAVAHCLAQSFTALRTAGLVIEKTTCVGHSLGAHMCGLMANYLTFRMERIIALDPARPLMKPGNMNRLDVADAKSVQVIHTNAGYYGEQGRVGHVDFCVNGGRHQPYCGNTTNINLCSHIWSICYLAQSLFDDEPIAEPCNRRCPSGVNLPGQLNGIQAPRFRRRERSRMGFAVGYNIPMGQGTPMNAQGSYCIRDDKPPFCPKTKDSPGDTRCCLAAPEWFGL